MTPARRVWWSLALAWMLASALATGVHVLMLRQAWQTDAGAEPLWSSAAILAGLLILLGAPVLGLAAWWLHRWQRDLAGLAQQARALARGALPDPARPAPAQPAAIAHDLADAALRVREVLNAQAEQVSLLQRQAQLDVLTGLPLRTQFVGQIGSRLDSAGGPRVALLLVRVLHLDAVNARLGRDGTDRLLGSLADLLQTYVDRVPGTFAGRLNGSDFALCLPVEGVARETAESLRATLATLPALRSGAAEVAVGAVDGLAETSAGAALAAADAALARAEAGDGLHVEQTADAAAVGAQTWRRQIADALDEGRVQLAEFAVRDRAGALLHLECPLRVQLEPGGEYQAAERWLALARRSRLLPPVDLRGVELALHAIVADGRPRAVHASRHSLASPAFIAEVAQRLQLLPDAASHLAIEVSDLATPAARARCAAAAEAWRRHGARVGVEHAGAAPQDLPLLRDCGVAYVKVDGRHLRGAAADAAVRGYALSLVGLIHGLRLSAIAEGIDDARDIDVLWGLGFDAATGPALA